MTTTDNITNQIKPLLLRTITFTNNGRVLKSGKLKSFNIKQHYIRFALEQNNNTKYYELPYPFRTEISNDTMTFNYHISSFCPIELPTFFKIKFLNLQNTSRLFDSEVAIQFNLYDSKNKKAAN